ncbi:MAG: hypothetical protein EOP84_07605 [Verrucomicrobiaceae bacterium]|nr:MAG: hypothetical protein EOP84_07605 [Verrucomicrobiaceae bacterium]
MGISRNKRWLWERDAGELLCGMVYDRSTWMPIYCLGPYKFWRNVVRADPSTIPYALPEETIGLYTGNAYTVHLVTLPYSFLFGLRIRAIYFPERCCTLSFGMFTLEFLKTKQLLRHPYWSFPTYLANRRSQR